MMGKIISNVNKLKVVVWLIRQRSCKMASFFASYSALSSGC